jgi:hypothetical protein
MTEQQRAAMQAALEALDAPRDAHWNKRATAATAALRAALAQADVRCPDCLGSGARDSGGVTPWGEPIMVPCDCSAALAQQDQPKPAAWIDNSGHPRHISYVQSATERRLYGPLRPLYEGAPQQEPSITSTWTTTSGSRCDNCGRALHEHISQRYCPMPVQQQQAEPVEFDHSTGADRYKVVRGSFWWHIRIGDSTENVGKFHTKLAAEDMALKLLTAFRDGAFSQYKTTSPQLRKPSALTGLETSMSDNLPPLPETTWMLWRHSTYEDPYCSHSEGYTEGDMLAYATAAVAAERERWADEIENRRVEIRQRAIDYLALDTEARALQDEVERLRAELEQRTAAVIVSESGQALACSASVSAAYGELIAERDALKADASRWRFWRCQWPVLTTMRVAQDVGLDLTTFYVSSPEDMDGATDAAIDAARKA